MSDQFAHDNEIRSVLERGLTGQRGQGGRIASLSRHPFEYASSCSIEELEIVLQDRSRLTVIFKNLSPTALLGDARRVRPAFLYDPQREIRIYQQVFSKVNLGAAHCFATHEDERTGQIWLFLEKVIGRELYRVGNFSLWEEAARWLASFHQMSNVFAMEASDLRLLQWDMNQFELCLEWAQNSLCSRHHGSKVQNKLDDILATYEKVILSLASQPKGLIHGEFFASNVLVDNCENQVRVCPIDWETAGWGPGMMDLAALGAGKWNEAQREAMLRAYWQVVDESLAAEWGSIAAVRTAYTSCRFHLAVRMLGQMPNWSPPSAHQHNWLEEAELLAKEVAAQ